MYVRRGAQNLAFTTALFCVFLHFSAVICLHVQGCLTQTDFMLAIHHANTSHFTKYAYWV